MTAWAPSLLDLFASPHPGRGSAARARVLHPLPKNVISAVPGTPQSSNRRDDTLCLAAWLLLQHQWRGLPSIEQLEYSSIDGQPHWRTWTHHSGTGLTALEWIQSVDLARHSSTLQRHLESEGAASIGSAWMGTCAISSLDAEGAHLPTMIGLSAAEDSLFIDFDTSSLRTKQAHTILAALVHTAGNLVARPHSNVEFIDTIGADEKDRLLVQWNSSPVCRPPAQTVHEVFAHVAARRSGATAVVHGSNGITYAQLDHDSSTLGAHLQAQGVTSDSVVGVALERSPQAIVTLLGILKAGAAYLPLDVAYPADRLAFMLNDAKVQVVVTTEAHRHLFPNSVRILSPDIASDPASAQVQPVPTNGHSLAYVMYTSGSTGAPKGIEISHLSILRLVIDAQYVDLSPTTTVLHAAPLGFDASTLEIWGPLLNGGRCVLHDEGLPTPRGLARTIREHSVTTAWLTAALFNAVVDEDPGHLRGLMQLLIGGEALSVPHVRRCLTALPDMALINGYGPTECTTFTLTYAIPHSLPPDVRSIPVGRPITDTQAYILSPSLHLLPAGLVGELFVGGPGLARGYLGRADLTSERFLPHPLGTPGERLYRTGDLVRYLEDGNIEFVGRADRQVKIRGFRIELGEIEAALSTHPSVKAGAVIAHADTSGHTRLVAYSVAATRPVAAAELRAHLATRLPEFMVPATYVWVESLPITPNGKLDHRALPPPPTERPDLSEPYLAPVTHAERQVCAAFAEALGVDCVGRSDNFFELGGSSLLVLKVLARLQREGGRGLSTNTFFSQPTPQALARVMTAGADDSVLDPRRVVRRSTRSSTPEGDPVAIVAMAGRFPGARDVEEFWRNLCEGRDTVSRFLDAELDPSLPASLINDPCYVKARGVIEGVDMFDAAFFGISPREAELTDPQHRIFLELCWECLERAGYAPDRSPGPVGVFAGMYNATYLQRHVAPRPDLIEKLGEFQVMLGNEKDYIATRIAHKLNLTGPAVSVHTACSTSLVAIAQAFVSLRARQCDMALAGGVSILCPPQSGYLYQEGAMLSPDGRTRSFDAQAQGTVFSDGAAVVALKRLPDALADGDPIFAVIRGVAVNNDGREKASFTAPSVDGQAAVISAAHASAGVEARTISYVETHGTATPLGDPVEIEGLNRAFRHGTSDTGFCRIGSVKSNVGHLVIAAGATGVIKTALALTHETLPASIHFERPNPKLDLANSPFTVNGTASAWPRSSQPRRAGISSFGVGGTNAHVILEEAPQREASSAAIGLQILQLSARTRPALEVMAGQLADYLEGHPHVNLADVAHTLNVGRSRFTHRLSVVADSTVSASAALRSPDHPSRAIRSILETEPALLWLFPGQSSQYAGMGRGLYHHDAVFRQAFDDCLDVLNPILDFDLRARMFSGTADALVATGTTQPAIFCLEYALARVWLARHASPAGLIGHSVGEFVAAVLAGVMSMPDAARLVAVRGALMQALPAGSMLSVRASFDTLSSLLPSELSLAAENGPTSCVVAGPTSAIEAFRHTLEAQGIVTRALQTSHAFHSSMMDAAVAPFEAEVRQVQLAAPRLPIVSTLTGTWLTSTDATSPRYWARHLREPVRFSPAVREALARHQAVFVEIGPRGTLSTLVRQHGTPGKGTPIAVASLTDDPDSEPLQVMRAQGQLWTAGIEIGTAATPTGERRRLPLPTYPFERKRHWIEANAGLAAASEPSAQQSVVQIPALTPDPLDLPSPNAAMTTTQITTPGSRTPHLVARLRELFEDVAGVDLADADATANFVELGLDSLTLTQAALQVKKQFSVPITFRQLMEQYRSFDTLAGFLDASLPPDPKAPPQTTAAPLTTAPAVASLPTASAIPAGIHPLAQQVIQQQMHLMAQQLALLGGTLPASGGFGLEAQAGPVVSPGPGPTATATPAVDSAANGASGVASENAGAVRYDVKKAFGAIARIHTQGSPLTNRQQARLEAFIRRYTERTAKSKAYTVEHRSHLADPRVVNGFRPMTKEITYQIVIERSKGPRMWDLDGNEYVDVLNGFGMNLFGWQPDFINEAVRNQLDLGYDIGPQHPLAGDVARLVCELTGFDRAGLCNTGSEAVMAAVRIARTVTGRNTLVLFTGSYHGTFDEVVVRAGRGHKGIPGAPGIMPGAYGDVRVLDYGTPEALEFIRQHADDLAAVLVEPVQSRRPDFQPVEFLKEVRAITERSGTCLIFDEVITGFRAHLGGVQAVFDIRADLACYGKVIGGGFPVGVVAGTREYMDALDGGAWQYGDASMPTVGVTYFAGTFVRHPLALAAAKASLQHLKQRGRDLQNELNLCTSGMVADLNWFCREAGAPIEIRCFSSLWRVSWLEDHPLQDLLFAMMRSRGVHILDNFPCFMTTAHTQEDIALITRAFKESVAELQQAEFLPRRAPEVTTISMDSTAPPVPGARLGRDPSGNPAWFIPQPDEEGKGKVSYVMVRP